MKIKIPKRTTREVCGEFLAIYNDPQGMPRAWGIGSTKLMAVAAAREQLLDYRDEKRAVGDPLADAEFTCTITPYEGEQSKSLKPVSPAGYIAKYLGGRKGRAGE
jgi:hypothetical protein